MNRFALVAIVLVASVGPALAQEKAGQVYVVAGVTFRGRTA